MRQRKVKNLEEKIDSYSRFFVTEPGQCRGKWQEIFGNDREAFLELGCGKGQFITTLAERNPLANFIAVEGQHTVLLRALEKIEEKGLSNVMVIPSYIQDIRDYFEKGELAGIYLNFSDPWPKERHAKRRLTHHRYLNGYRDVVKDGGFVEFKTDNDGLFDFSLEEIEGCGLKVEECTRDLHASDYLSREITTEYEDRFRAAGKNINYVKFIV